MFFHYTVLVHHAVLVSAAVAAAHGGAPYRGPQDPPAPFARALQLEQLKATIAITDAVATTDLEQVFRNTTASQAEGIYLWPLPDGATVSRFELWVDGKPMQGELLDKDRARGVYQDIVRRSQDPGLLEWAGLGCVRCSIFPVAPNGEARVRLRYSQVLDLSGGAREYALPLRLNALAPQGLRSLVIDGTIEASRALAAVYSPSHSLDVRRDGELRARFSFESARPRLERDFSLLVGSADRELGALLLAHRRAGEEGYFSLVLTPRVDTRASAPIPKDVIFVVDTSGSMAGEKMEQAKKALHQALGRLGAEDRFALIRFSTDADSFRTAPVAATSANAAAAHLWIDGLEARGGTNIDEALGRALAMASGEERLSLVFFLTDGLPTVGTVDPAEILASVKRKNARGLRIFTFGVGYDVNTMLLDAIAKETRASREYVRPGEDVETRVSTLYDKVANPALTDVVLTIEGVTPYDVVPNRLPDLFHGSQLVITGRYRGDGRARVSLSGTVQGAKKSWDYDLDFPRVAERNESLRPLWAARRVGFLFDEVRLRGASPEVVEEIKRLGREYNIVTPYTSFLVVEEGRRLAQARGLDSLAALRYRGPGDRWVAADEDEAKLSLVRLEELAKKADGEAAVDGSIAARDLSGSAGAARPSGPATPSGPTTPSGNYGPSTPGAPARKPPADRAEELARALTRNVGNRVFHLVDGTWVDSAFAESARAKVVKLAFLSEEYFKLLDKEPELAPIFALGKRVLVSWKGNYYETQ